MSEPPVLERLPAGTELQVGSHKAKIVNYISAGGFAHVYLVQISEKPEFACLKRVVVPNKQGLNLLRAEVEVMQRLAHCDYVVKYLDSHASRVPNTHCYEVLVLMELCPNKSLLDHMNARLSTKLSEPEILKIMLDISQGVYAMHRLKLIHRDIKIENVLIDDKYTFKLCDFGSTCPVLRPPRNHQEFQILTNDLLRQTTPQYRPPEMIDLYRGLPIDEKSDIWALGIFLYKLCYYITPFETAGELAILHTAYRFPSTPRYSTSLKSLINIMLQENPVYRPNIYQVTAEICRMMDIDIPKGIEDFYLQGEYKHPPAEQMHPPIEQFTASVIPMFSPFKSMPQDPVVPVVTVDAEKSQPTEATGTSVDLKSSLPSEDSLVDFNMDRFPEIQLSGENKTENQPVEPEPEPMPKSGSKWSSHNPFPQDLIDLSTEDTDRATEPTEAENPGGEAVSLPAQLLDGSVASFTQLQISESECESTHSASKIEGGQVKPISDSKAKLSSIGDNESVSS
ncbi:hypothetical protein KL918_000086 [Ogataea parapolymorpha]|uniref:Ser-Thr protein kinase, member (With Ark1p and Prk1p) of the Ark kinase family n=1 Tax=Ogataea parapolymorpha (strain ATCC 26012 / BCRC 20466 / JCM 22074 / NRRL Y-7560 / DL-1) TaxID=871575 RepID=W1Q849_OGAPD|nr:Ser-Thr protein kinase, member (with Ark1p and Prk1p) of the Ark kinase family [Ogataea parapolymorpha DL-1]ESW96136.1 Ser-Thr protein kinase, member (with Ark1p and Prk1p) of the Ark kinase family [Ogataea parapolymorpha DL-1]KAG7869882.1 hypothetical protein KL918_000086 [Ogataea parapolymorpha]KAG7873170.1 hypothetical protein KL916_002471 [Ogataea parapolymorpha]